MIFDEMETVLASAVVLGFVGSGHCIGMCGGIAGALGQMTPQQGRGASLFVPLVYSAGRIASYSLLGAIAGLLGGSIDAALGLGPALRVVTGLMIVGFGFYVAGWSVGAARLERIGLHVWRRLAPLVGRIGTPDRIWKILSLGALWGWLPCGLVYSAVAASLVTGSAAGGAAFMLCFGVGTIPALCLASGAAEKLGKLLARHSARRAAGVLLVLFGCWTLYAAIGPKHMDHSDHSAHSGHAVARGK